MIVSFSFFGVLVLGALVFWALPAQKLRTAWLTIASLGFILLHDRFAALMALLLAGYTYGVAGLMERRGGKARSYFAWGSRASSSSWSFSSTWGFSPARYPESRPSSRIGGG